MSFLLYESLIPTYVVYCDALDLEAAEQIAKMRGVPLLSTAKDKDPAVYDPVYDESNLILVGGWSPNPYTRHYFHDEGLVEEDPENGKMIGEGVSEDGKRYIRTIMRPNGTTVTAVFGWHVEDTLQAAYDFTKIDPLHVGVAAGVSLLLIAVAVGTGGEAEAPKRG